MQNEERKTRHKGQPAKVPNRAAVARGEMQGMQKCEMEVPGEGAVGLFFLLSHTTAAA